MEDPSARPVRLTDVARIYDAEVRGVHRPAAAAGFRARIEEARRNGWKVTISGMGHSQGGHTYADGTLHLSTLGYDRVLRVDPVARTVRVEAGATWADVQEAANPHNLAVKVMQSSNIFTVGGSLGVNAHGRDPRLGSLIETVRSFRLLGPDGRIRHVDRETDPELFRLAIGGYGLFGVILDVELELTDNAVYEKRTVVMDVAEYPAWLRTRVLGRPDVGLHFGRLSIVPGAFFLRETYAVDYRAVAPRPDSVVPLEEESGVALYRLTFGLSRGSDRGKAVRWSLQTAVEDDPDERMLVTRNNAMRPPVRFLEYRSDEDTDILQEYFVPLDSLVSFLEGMRETVRDGEVDLLSLTLRVLPAGEEPFLSYQCPETCVAVVIYVNIGLDEEGLRRAGVWTRELVDRAHAAGGSYYLAYQLFPTREQIRRAYPALDRFFELKRAHDPGGMFTSGFYEHYR